MTSRPKKPTRHHRWWLALGLWTLVATGPIVAGQESAPSETMLRSQGRVSYNLYCRSCHGSSGAGDGSVAEILTVPPADLTRISARNGGDFPEEEIHDVIDGREMPGHGSRDMPVWGLAFKITEETEDENVVEEKITALVTFLKSIQVTDDS